ncbi:site-specific integrase [Buttiauxella sp. 3AFRM03]|uniref:site-specific integrase n=1 Tax=Buttiauxella sp. 3AFRM03 TaxID=2479367 RepID=UPI000EF81CF7|nr:site-specific integrase [Buttiauxella sp. 3AFRM03]AYN25720.1 site-specific integrase [Buttiauxella sp. 3AFRM03]AYN30213.1 site-specific integrase [Buttiauxella sp. 3AFRM03]
MSIFRRGEVWYASYTAPDGSRIRQSLGTTDKRQASELHDRLKAEAWRVSRLGEVADISFEAACVRWIEEKAHKKSLNADKSRIKFWLQYFAGMNLSEITEDKIYSAVKGMINRSVEIKWQMSVDAAKRKGKEIPALKPKEAAQGTKTATLAFIKSLLRAAERDWKVLERAPVIKVQTPKNRRIRWLEPHEALRLIDACVEPLKSVVEFALSTGLRRSNILNLEWQQIDMQRKVAWIHPEQSKSNRAIGVALNDTACAVLKRQIGNHHRWVFVHQQECTSPQGRKMPAVRKMSGSFSARWKLALKNSGIEDFRFHDLRHTWASWLVQAGVPVSVLQEMGGWESIEMVRRYAHLAPNHLSEHSKKIDSIFSTNGTEMSHIVDVLKISGS